MLCKIFLSFIELGLFKNLLYFYNLNFGIIYDYFLFIINKVKIKKIS